MSCEDTKQFLDTSKDRKWPPAEIFKRIWNVILIENNITTIRRPTTMNDYIESNKPSKYLEVKFS